MTRHTKNRHTAEKLTKKKTLALLLRSYPTGTRKSLTEKPNQDKDEGSRNSIRG